MQHLDEGTIHAWLDGALDPEEAARVEQHVAACAECAAAVAEARGLAAGASRILVSLDDVPAGVIPRSSSPRARSLWSTLHLSPARAAAAALVFVAAGTALVLRQKPHEAVADKSLVFVARDTNHAPIVTETNTASKALPPPKAMVPLAAVPPQRSEAQHGNAVVAAAQPEARAVDSMAVATSPRLTTGGESKAVAAPAPGASAADVARRIESVAGAAPSIASPSVAKPSRMKSALSQNEVMSRVSVLSGGGCYAVEGDSLPLLPRQIVLDTSDAAVTANALQSLARSNLPVAERHAVGAIAGDTVRPVAAWHWSSRPGGIRLEMATPSGAAAQLDSVSTSGDLRGPIDMNGRRIELSLRRIDCPAKR